MTGAVLVTRPEPEATRTAATLKARGFSVRVEPMLTIRLTDGPPLDLSGVGALLVTSVNGVRAAERRTDRRDIPLYAVGSRTAEAARKAGFDVVHDAGGAAADLAVRIALELRPEQGRLLHLSGAEVAVDLAALLGPRGYRVTRVVGYEAAPAPSLPESLRRALATREIGYVLLFSARTARTFVSLCRAAGLQSGPVALCLSPAVAAAAGGIVWQGVRVAPAPNEAALLALLPG